MDIKCATCQEPWDHHHLLHDMPQEIWDGVEDSSSQMLIDHFEKSDKTKIPPLLRQDLEDLGWKFGRTVICVLECGCCASNAGEGEDPEEVAVRKNLRLELEEMLGDDLDGIISEMETVDRFAEVG